MTGRAQRPKTGLGYEHQEGTVTPGHGLRAITNARGLTVSEKVVLYVLLSHADREGWCFPSQGTIAEESELSRGTVNKAINRLIHKGLISHLGKHRRASVQEPGVWEVQLNIDEIEAAATDTPSAKSGRGGDTRAAKSANDAAKEGTMLRQLFQLYGRPEMHNDVKRHGCKNLRPEFTSLMLDRIRRYEVMVAEHGSAGAWTPGTLDEEFFAFEKEYLATSRKRASQASGAAPRKVAR